MTSNKREKNFHLVHPMPILTKWFHSFCWPVVLSFSCKKNKTVNENNKAIDKKKMLLLVNNCVFYAYTCYECCQVHGIKIVFLYYIVFARIFFFFSFFAKSFFYFNKYSQYGCGYQSYFSCDLWIFVFCDFLIDQRQNIIRMW